MKTIGLIGGMSWESTVTYYQVINEKIREELGGLHSAKILINSIDFAPLAKAQENDDWDFCNQLMIEAGEKLQKAGADFIVIGANTMHIAERAMREKLSVPILHIATATAERIAKDGIRRIGLLGTKYTLTKDFYKKKIEDAGIEVIIAENDIDTVNNIIYDELCLGILKDDSKQELLRIINVLKDKGAQGVILGCTELGLLIKKEDCDLPVYDTTIIHGEEAALASIASE